MHLSVFHRDFFSKGELNYLSAIVSSWSALRQPCRCSFSIDSTTPDHQQSLPHPWGESSCPGSPGEQGARRSRMSSSEKREDSAKNISGLCPDLTKFSRSFTVILQGTWVLPCTPSGWGPLGGTGVVAVVLCMVAVGLEGGSEASSSEDALLPQTFIGWQLSGMREQVIAKRSLLLKIGF